MKKALITGITGQDGYYLSKFLLEFIFSQIKPVNKINIIRIAINKMYNLINFFFENKFFNKL